LNWPDRLERLPIASFPARRAKNTTTAGAWAVTEQRRTNRAKGTASTCTRIERIRQNPAPGRQTAEMGATMGDQTRREFKRQGAQMQTEKSWLETDGSFRSVWQRVITLGKNAFYSKDIATFLMNVVW